MRTLLLLFLIPALATAQEILLNSHSDTTLQFYFITTTIPDFPPLKKEMVDSVVWETVLVDSLNPGDSTCEHWYMKYGGGPPDAYYIYLHPERREYWDYGEPFGGNIFEYSNSIGLYLEQFRERICSNCLRRELQKMTIYQVEKQTEFLKLKARLK